MNQHAISVFYLWLLALAALVQLPTAQVCVGADVQAITSWTTGLTGPDRNTAGSDRLLVFTAGMEAGSDRTITSATYGGRALTQVVTTPSNGSYYGRCYLFYLPESEIALASSNNFSVTWSGSTDNVLYAARMYENVDQSSPIRDFDSASASSSSPNPIVTPAVSFLAGDMVVAAAQCGNAQAYSWNNGFIERTDNNASSSQHSTAEFAALSDGSITASATNNSPNRQALVAAVIAGTATPELFYVRTDGSNSNSGDGPSASEAWQTIDYALDNSSVGPGDTIYVMSGTYNESISPSRDGSSASPISLIADSSGSIFGTAGDVLVQAPSGNHALDMDSDDYLSFTGFKMRGDGSNDTIDILNCTGLEFEKCEIYNGLRGVEPEGSSTTVSIINCLIHSNSDDGIRLYSGTTTVLNTTIVDNGSDGVEQDGGTMTITNSIIADNSSDGLDLNSGTMTHTYNLVFGNGDSQFEGTSASTGEIQQDPQFTNGYELSSGSPAIDAGTGTGAPSDDIEGSTRPEGSGYDMGAYEYVPPASDLLGHWKLDETTGTTATDSSGNGNDGDLYGGVTFNLDSVSPGPRGDALQFNGSTDYISIPNDSTLQPTTALTIAAFVKGESWGSGSFTNVILRKGEGNPNNYQLAIADGQAALYLDDSDTGGIRGDTVLEADRWYHVAATWDGSFVRIYVDGVLDMTPVAYSGSIGADTRAAYIGGRSGTDYFDGCLDDVRLYGKALSQTEVMDLYGQMIYYKFDEGTGATAADTSYHNLDATLQGSTDWTSGRVDGAIDFDGFSDAVTAATFTPPENGTVLLWMKVPGTPAVRGRLFGVNNAFEIRHETTGHLEFDLNIGTGGTFSTTAPVDTSGKWYHIAATFDSTNDQFAVYIDGTLDTSGSLSLSQQSGGVLSIGNRTGASDYFVGALDELRIFDRVLLAEEIAQIRGSGLPQGVRIIKWVEIK